MAEYLVEYVFTKNHLMSCNYANKLQSMSSDKQSNISIPAIAKLLIFLIANH